jgi:hypothetical protein
MSAIPDNDEALLTAGQTSAALTEAGFPVAEATLDTKVTRGRWPALPEIRKHASLSVGPDAQVGSRASEQARAHRCGA